jgi:hypothetical protein
MLYCLKGEERMNPQRRRRLQLAAGVSTLPLPAAHQTAGIDKRRPIVKAAGIEAE